MIVSILQLYLECRISSAFLSKLHGYRYQMLFQVGDFELLSLFRHFETEFLWKNSCLTTFAPERDLHSFAAKNFWPQLRNYSSDGYLQALSCDTNGFKVIRRGTSPPVSPKSNSNEPYFHIQVTIKYFWCNVVLLYTTLFNLG